MLSCINTFTIHWYTYMLTYTKMPTNWLKHVHKIQTFTHTFVNPHVNLFTHEHDHNFIHTQHTHKPLINTQTHVLTHSLNHMSLVTNSLLHWYTGICLNARTHIFTYIHILNSQTKKYSHIHSHTNILSRYHATQIHNHPLNHPWTSLHMYSHTNTLHSSYTWMCSHIHPHNNILN